MRKSEISRRIAEKVKRGEMIRASLCELCGIPHRLPTQAHHAYGYNNPFNVWWLCCRCNIGLRGKLFHCGLVTRNMAKSYLQTGNLTHLTSEVLRNSLLLNKWQYLLDENGIPAKTQWQTIENVAKALGYKVEFVKDDSNI